MFWFLFVIFTIVVGSANAGKLAIDKLTMTDPNVTPTKIVYKTFLPLTFEVSSQHKNKDDACQGVVEAQFGMIAVYGKKNGINIIPSWQTPTTYKISIYFMEGDKKVDSKVFTDFQFPIGEEQNHIYTVTFDYNTVSIVSNVAKPQIQSINPAFLPDFIETQYLSLSFFQPIQGGSDESVVNKCNLILDYNGSFAWAPNPLPTTESPPALKV